MAAKKKSTEPVINTPSKQETKPMSANFSDVLNKKLDTVEKPKPLPAGTYFALINAAPDIKPRGQNNNLAAEFTFKILQPTEDVDAEALAEQGGIRDRTLRYTLWLTDDALWRAKQFIENCGVEDTDISLTQGLQACIGAQVKVLVKQVPSKDGEELFANIDKVLKV